MQLVEKKVDHTKHLTETNKQFFREETGQLAVFVSRTGQAKFAKNNNGWGVNLHLGKAVGNG